MGLLDRIGKVLKGASGGKAPKPDAPAPTEEPKPATKAMPAAANRGGKDAVSIFYDSSADAARGLRGDRNPATPEFIGQNDQST